MIRKTFALAAAVGCLQASPALAEDEHYDGSDPLLCTLLNAQQCDVNGCERVAVHEIDVPKYIRVDFEKELLTTTEFAAETRSTPIERFAKADNRLILQGTDEESEEAEDAKSWTLLIADPTGIATLTLASEEVAFVAFGACVPVE